MNKTETAAPAKKNTRELIVTTAFRLFSRQGYRDTSVADIAREAGLSKGLMYHYFDSKEELLKGIFNHYQSQTVYKTDWDPKAPPLNNLQKLIDISLDYLKSQSEIRRFSLLMSLQHTVSEELREIVSKGKTQWEAAFAEIFEFLGYHQPREEALYLSALLDGLAVRYLAAPESYPLEEVRRLIYRNYHLQTN